MPSPGWNSSREPRPWYRLDNAAKIFPSVTSDRLTQFFRVAVRLKSPVQPQVLRDALASILVRFPSFQVRLKAGVFWYSLVQEPSIPPIYPESTSPCMPFRRGDRSPHLFRVRWFGRRLAVEFNHTLTDGLGGLTFVRSLVAEYLNQSGFPSRDPDDLRRMTRSPDPEESNDEFQKLYDRSIPQAKAWDRVFHPQSVLLPPGAYAVTTGRLPLAATLSLAKARNATLTEFLAATLLAAFQDDFLALSAEERKRAARPVRLVLPVNLRTFFPSRTLRNFFVVVPVEIDLRLGVYGFEELVRKVHHQLQAEMDPRLLKKQIVRNLWGELNPLGRVLPLPIKSLILIGVFRAFQRQQTASLSNLGPVSWPAPWDSQVLDAEFIPPPSPICRVNAGVVSVGDTLSVTFGSLSRDSRVERAFFTRLRTQGLPVTIESNRQYLEV